MRLPDKVNAAREDLFTELERLAHERAAEQTALVRGHLQRARRDSDAFAGALCLVAGRAFGLGAEEARQVAAIVGFVEAAALALRRLPDETSDTELPLALNAADALYSLAHIALIEYEAAEGGRGRGLAGALDAGARALWEKAADADSYFGDREEVAATLGRLAGQLAARAAGKGEEAVAAAGEYGSRLALRLVTSEVSGGSPMRPLLSAEGLTVSELDALNQLVN